MKPSLGVNLAGLKLRNPVMTASGTFGSVVDQADYVDVDALGAIIVKSVTLRPTPGNPPPRICETPSGMLNSIGLQNLGVDRFISEELPSLIQRKPALVVSIAGKTIEEYVEIARKLQRYERINAIELNVSCPNVKQGGMAFGISASILTDLVAKVRLVYRRPLIVKLSPNVTDIVKMAKAAVKGGADIISLINTITGMMIDIESRKPMLATNTGGLSGPAIMPVALRMTWQVARAVKAPIIGTGGISCAEDAIQFLLAGASAVAVGTASFVDPKTAVKISAGLDSYLESRGIKDIYSIIGKVEVYE